MTRTKGWFITFEGGEGSGKSTQIARLAATLRLHGHEVIVTREPGGSPMGERIRAVLLDPDNRFDAVTQAFLFSAARRDHVHQLIVPALARGAIVISDRFADSTRAYQQAAGEVPDMLIDTLTTAAIGDTIPDLTILLDLDPATGMTRANKRREHSDRPDQFEAATLSFHAKVRAGYLTLARQEPGRFAVVDAAGSVDDVAAAVREVVHARLLPGASETRSRNRLHG
jgi:dTMP kinase